MDNQQERVREDSLRVVPFLVYESAQARAERTIKRLIIALIMTIILLFLSNAFWIHEWSSYDWENEEIVYTQDGRGLNSINFGSQGDLNNEPNLDYSATEEDTP